jgi:TonB family protein
MSFSSLRGGVPSPVVTFTTNGTFRTTLQESDYQIGWSGLPVGYHIKSIKAGNADLLTGPLKLSGSSFPNIEVLLGVDEKPPWVKVSGRISGLSGVPSTNALRIGLSGSVSIDPLDVAVNPDGSFQFERVLPGLYTAVLNPRLPIPALPVIVPNQDVANLTITVPPLKEVPGAVTNQGPNSLPPSISLAWNETPGGTSANVSVSAPVKADGTFNVLIPLGDRRITVSSPGYSVQSATFGAADLLRESLKLSGTSVEEIRLTFAPTLPRAVTGGVVGGVLGGIVTSSVGGVVGGLGASPPPPPPPPPPAPIQRIGGDVAQANLVSSVPPVYPPLAQAARVQGVVLLQVQISKEGAVEDIRVIAGHPLLNEAAIEAVKQWRYRPQPSSVVTTVTVNFSSR